MEQSYSVGWESGEIGTWDEAERSAGDSTPSMSLHRMTQSTVSTYARTLSHVKKAS
jgi:hypothetical protein